MNAVIIVKHNIVKSLINKLMDENINFIVNYALCRFELKDIVEIIVSEDSDCIDIQFTKVYFNSFIHQLNIKYISVKDGK